MQKFIQKVGARVANAVTGHDGSKLGDEILQDCKQRLDELEQQVTSVRSQFATYAEQMMQSCEASVLLSKSVSDFYRAANNSARSESVKVYEEVQDAAANNAVAIYQRQLQMEDGVISELDQWLQIVARVNEQIEEADRLRQAAETASSRLETLRNKNTGSGLFGANDGTDLQNRIEETERAQKNFETDFENARDEVRDNVARIMQKRFTMFDRVYVQILECQVQFFERASKDVDGFRRSIRNYRRKFPRDSGSNMSSALSHSNSSLNRTTSDQRGAGDQSPPKQRGMRTHESAPPQKSGSNLKKVETDFLGDMFDMPNGGGPNQNGANLGGAESSIDREDSTDIVEDFGAFITAPPTSDSNSRPQTKRQVSDLFGLNLFGAHGYSDTELDVHQQTRAAAPLNANRRGSRSSMDLSAPPSHRGPTASEMFDDDFWGSTPVGGSSSAPTSRPAQQQSSNQATDPMDDFMSPTPTQATSPTPLEQEEKQHDPPHLMQNIPMPDSGGRGTGVLNTSDAAERREFVRRLQENEKINHDNREQAQDAVEDRLREWEYKGDVRRNLRSLLTSMDRVLWEGAKWKPVQMSDLLNANKISKKYKKALNAVHPDKISLVRGYTPEQIALAEGVFMALNEAWIEYEKTQS